MRLARQDGTIYASPSKKSGVRVSSRTDFERYCANKFSQLLCVNGTADFYVTPEVDRLIYRSCENMRRIPKVLPPAVIFIGRYRAGFPPGEFIDDLRLALVEANAL